MATVTPFGGKPRVDNSANFDFAKDPHNGVVIQNSATQFVVDYTIPFTMQAIYGGIGFGGFDADGVPTLGTITSMSFTTSDLGVRFASFSLPVQTFLDFIATNDTAGLLALIFSSADLLNGVGVDGVNVMNGYGGDDIITGGTGLFSQDVLNGGAGNDVLRPSSYLYIADALDGGAGTDTVDFINFQSQLDRPTFLEIDLSAEHYRDAGPQIPLQYCSIVGVENVVGLSSLSNHITGNERANLLVGGNLADVLAGLAGADRLEGGGGADTLDGGGGVDTMIGGTENDTYVVNLAGDVTTETSALGGSDLVKSSVTRTLGANLEKLILTGSAAINGTGNTLANVITGNTLANTLSGLGGADRLIGGAGGDRLIGGLGLDILTGNSGADKFVFNSAPAAANRDTITDYNVAADTIQIENAVFVGIGGAGVLAAAAFNVGASAAEANDRIIYDSATGALYFDADGVGGAAQIQFATLSAGLPLTAADFVVI